MFNFKKRSFKKFDIVLFLTTLVLCLYGFVVLYSATLSLGPGSYLKTQIAATLVGFIGMFIIILIDYEFFGKLYIPIYIFGNLLLVLVLIFGIGDTGANAWGARSWLTVGPITFQPSEFVKVMLIISLAKFMDNNKEKINEPFTLLKVLAFAGLPVGLILMQPDAGTAMVFMFFIAAMLFAAGLKWRYIAYALSAALVSLPIIWFNLDVFQKNRVYDFIDPYRNPTGSGLQAIQGRIAVGSGQIFGRGLFQGLQTQNRYVPAKETDFIFAVIAEELGFIGGAVLIFLYFVLLSRFLKIAANSTDKFGSYMIVGFTAMFIFHIWENIGMVIGLMPITGIPLPFMSYGGTFQLVNLVCIGLILSVGLRKEALSFGNK